MGEARGREDETRWVQREPERLRTKRAEKTDREKEEGGSGRPGRDGVRRQHRGVVSLPQGQFAKLQPTLSGNEGDQSQHTPQGHLSAGRASQIYCHCRGIIWIGLAVLIQGRLSCSERPKREL